MILLRVALGRLGVGCVVVGVVVGSKDCDVDRAKLLCEKLLGGSFFVRGGRKVAL